MATPITFNSISPRLGLPFLFPAQAQKEFYINEAYALIDALTQPVIEGIADTPPSQVLDGECWLVGSNPVGAWAGYPEKLACSQAGSWLFAKPFEEMRIFDKSSGADLRYRNGWQVPSPVTIASGGAIVDTEARAAISQLIQALATLGLIRQSP